MHRLIRVNHLSFTLQLISMEITERIGKWYGINNPLFYRCQFGSGMLFE